jgi:esterase/lipase
MSGERRGTKPVSYPDADWADIDHETYEWSVLFFRMIKKLLRVNIKLHAGNQVEQGDIFLFNHFSRFETFIPQYLIYEATGAYSYAIASAEFFREDNALSRYLKKVGVVPHNHPHLFPLMARQILRGRKVIIFPEGGMVKDRRVLDNQGHYSIYSRLTGERRKQHTGPAVLAQGLEAFKATVRNAYCDKNYKQLQRWTETLQLDSLEQLLTSALKPTLIVPANITFYPMRASDNILAQAVKFFAKGLSMRQLEELKIEGNILFEDTDMDLRMGKPIDPYHIWHWWNRYLLEPVSSEFQSLDEVYQLYAAPKTLKQRILRFYFKKNADATRNEYMEQIYSHVTINLSHLASSLVMCCIEKGQTQISKHCFYTSLYIAIKRLQAITSINLHRSLLNPEDYDNLLHGKGKRFEYFISYAESVGLIAEDQDYYYFLPKLLQDYNFDSVRMENPVAVYNNEASPILAIREILKETVLDCQNIDAKQLARWRFEDECRALEWTRKYYARERFADINAQETADADPSPFFLEPKHPNGYGVLLVHGLLASPAELRSYGEYLHEQGYAVLGARLRGHGSSPYDLQKQTWEDWQESVRKAHGILTAFCEKIFVIGFSTGAALGLLLASEQKQSIAGIAAVATPIKFTNPAFMFIPLLHGGNKLLDWAPALEGIKPFMENDAEHPNINYRHVPIKSLYELRQLVSQLEENAEKITQPVLLLHADGDPIVSAKSSTILLEWLGSSQKSLKHIPAAHHGILMDNTCGVWKIIDQFLQELMI